MRPSAVCRRRCSADRPAVGSGKLPGVHRTILLQPHAPPKPAIGQPCNGCGVCCTLAPCPVGMLISGRRQGPCRALHWHADGAMYRCGLLGGPPRPLLTALARRWIAAGAGCDSDWEPALSPPVAESGGP